MKRIQFSFMIALALLAIVSCKKESNYKPASNQVLSAEVKSNLSLTADKIFQQTGTPGFLAQITVEGEPVFLIKRGTANLATGEPMDEKSAFRIASVTKTFTGTAVLILVDEGLISLDSSIAFYLPEKNIPSGNLITVRMLGNMTSGLFNYSDDPEMWKLFAASGYTMTFPPDSLIAISFRQPMNFVPGTGYEYCNTNTVLLGLLLEKITGKPASQVIYEKVLQPLNLKNTYMGGPFFMTGPYTHGYAIEDQGMLDATNFNPSWGYTAGAIISNLDDMNKWARYLAEGTLLSDAMKTERFNFGPEHYGFCIESIKYKNEKWVGHPGSIPGYNTQVWYNAARKTTMVVYSNCDNGLPAQSLLIAYIILLGDLYPSD